MKYEYMIRKLVEYLARKTASMIQKYRLEDLVGALAAQHLERSFDRISISIAKESGGTFWCRLCDKGPFTKRGFYLHLIRVHYGDLQYLVEEELRRVLEAVRR